MKEIAGTVAEETCLEWMYRDQAEELRRRAPRVLVLLLYGAGRMEEGFAAVRTVRQATARIQVWAEEEVWSRYGSDGLAERTGTDNLRRPPFSSGIKPETAEAVFLPVWSFSLMEKIVRLQDDDRFVQAVLAALWEGKPVGMLVHPYGPGAGTKPRNPGLQHRFEAYFAPLRSLGVNFVPPQGTETWIAGIAKEKFVITAEDVQRFAREGKAQIAVPERAIITPLALDLAKQHGVRFVPL